MVHYIRFLKPPRSCVAGKSHAAVKTLITITTDLGDDFYPHDLALTACLIPNLDDPLKPPECRDVLWRRGIRVLWIETTAPHLLLGWRLRVFQARSGRDGQRSDAIASEGLPPIVGCSSNILDPLRTSEVCGRSERCLMLQPGNSLRIEEDIGESIARHVWDAGVAMVGFLTSFRKQSDYENGWSALGRVLTPNPHSLRILELGSGCGIVGIAFAQLWPRCQVLLTDLAEATDILESNIAKARPAPEAELSQEILDWGNKLPVKMKDVTFDLVFVSDCTYNSDSIPALVKTLSAIAAISPSVLVVMALKKRHPSEGVLFELLPAAGFREVDSTVIALPDQGRIVTDQAMEKIEIYQYQRIVSPRPSVADF